MDVLWDNPETNVKELMPVLVDMHVDHIFPQSRIKDIDGFKELPTKVRRKLLNDPENLQPMPDSFNSSKGAKIESEEDGGWTKVVNKDLTIHPEYKKMLAQAERSMLQKINVELIKKGFPPEPISLP